MIELIGSGSGTIKAFRFTGELHDRDYKVLGPEVDAAVAAVGKIRLLAALGSDFHGWDLHAAWDDFQFTVNHYRDIERIAVIVDHRCKEWMARLHWPMAKGEVRYFEEADSPAAWDWLREGLN